MRSQTPPRHATMPSRWQRRMWSTLFRSLLVTMLALTAVLVSGGVFPAGATPRLATLATTTTATPDDWPTFLHDPQRSGASGEGILSTSNAAQLTRTWAYKTGGPIAASPTIVGGVVYVGSWDGYEYALDAATGALKWKTYLGITTTTTPNCYPSKLGISSAPAVLNGVVYVGGGDAYWYALDATSGAVLWNVYTGDNSTTGGHYNWSSPLLYNGYAYIGIASLGDCPLVQGQLLQVSLSTHLLVNTFNVVPTGQVGGGIWTSPALDAATNTIYVTTGTESSTTQSYAQALLAIDATTMTLKDYWKVPATQTVQDSDFGNSPTLYADATGNLLVTAINKNGIAYTFKRGSLAAGPVWQQQIAIGGDCPTCGQGSVSSGAFGAGALYLAGGNTTINGSGYQGAVRALDPATGAYRWQHGAPGIVIPALAYVNGLVLDGAGPTLEVLDAATGTRLYSYTTGATIYAAPSVSGGQIFTGGVDGTIYAFGLPSATPTPTPDPNCPTGWTCQDIAAPLPAGSETTSGGVWSVSASGTGVGGTSDQFRLMTQGFSGDTQVIARVASQQGGGTAAQAGIMLRQSADPTAPYYAVFATPGNGLTVQYRKAFGGATTVASQTTAGALPLYVEIQRRGDQFQAATSTDGTNYLLIGGTTVNVPLPALTLAGLAANSGVNGTAATATFDNVAVSAPNNTPATPTTGACPTGWTCADVGNPSLTGSQSLTNGVWQLQGGGSDIWGSTDQFHYVWQSLAADGAISAHITAQGNTDPWAKTGVMLRASSDASAAYYAAYVTPSNGLVVQYRSTQGFGAATVARATGTVPAYLQVARAGNTLTAYTSSDGVTWTALAGSSLVLSGMSGTVLAGLAVTSHTIGALSSVTADTVSLSTSAPLPPNACPTGWSCADLGYTSPVGGQSLSNGAWQVQGAGSDIWGISDQFHYIWQALAADGIVSAHVTAQTNTDPWAKAGVMLRASSDLGAAYYAALATPSNGVVVQYRASANGTAATLARATGAVPAYLRVGRSGTTYTTYTSSDGTTWTPLAGSSITLTGLSGTLLAGLAVTSHNGGALSNVTFDSVSIGAPPPSSVGCPTGWSCLDIGYTAPVGTQSLSNGLWQVQGAGSDIWGTSDQFHYAWQGLAADGTLGAHVTAQSNTDPWAKAGVMLRASADPGATYYAAYVTPGNGLVVQYRSATGASALNLASLAGSVPAYLRVGRSGTTYTAYTSADGTSWTLIPGSSVTLTGLSGTLLAGLAVTAHNGGVLSSVTLDSVALGTTPPPTACPAGWNCADIGYTAPSGSQSPSGGTWQVQGAGSDIWGTSDQFHYVWQSLAADGTLAAHVTAQTNTSVWAKAGVMLRASSDPSAAYYAAYVTPGNGLVVQYRSATGASALNLASLAGSVPAYLRVGRSGTTYTAYTSTDGTTWTLVPGSSVTLGGLSGTLLAGLAVTAHNGGVLSSVTFDSVALGTTAP